MVAMEGFPQQQPEGIQVAHIDILNAYREMHQEETGERFMSIATLKAGMAAAQNVIADMRGQNADLANSLQTANARVTELEAKLAESEVANPWRETDIGTFVKD